MCVYLRVCACMCVHVRASACACMCLCLVNKNAMATSTSGPAALLHSTPLPLSPLLQVPLPLPNSLRPHFARKRTSSAFAFYFRACNAIGRTKRLQRTDYDGHTVVKGEEGKGRLPARHGRLYIPLHMRNVRACVCVHTYVQSFGCCILFFTLFCFVFCLLILHFMHF